MYAFFLGWMRKPRHIPAPDGYRVAMISLTVPGSESLDIVRKQLVAMTRVSYPHESWILVDKVHSPEIEALAATLGVRYFSRHDRARWGDLVEYWNQPEAPFKAKTKAGNVNAWLDAIHRIGNDYELFTQLDIDHLPLPEYFDRVLGYFRSGKIAWVQAPSVYGNFDRWTSRGSAEQELVLQGPLQSGFYGFSGTPFIIGSHCTYRMSAIREIGGFQPTRAEDHLDTVILTSKGYEGVFVPEVIAVGDGPETFETYVGQQFAWAYSMITVMVRFTPRLIWRYTPRQAVQFLFVQTWYTLWSIAMCLMFCLPSIALLGNVSISHTNFWDFTAHSAPQTLVACLIWFWSRKWFQPRGVAMSWRGIILHVARWPVVLSALIQVILRVQKPYMITRKGVDIGTGRPFSLAPYVPYFILMLGSLGASWYYMAFTQRSTAQGYLLFSLEGAVMVLSVFCVVLICDLRALWSEGVSFARGILLRGRPLVLLALLTIFVGSTGVAASDRIVEAFSPRSVAPGPTTLVTSQTIDDVIGDRGTAPDIAVATAAPTLPGDEAASPGDGAPLDTTDATGPPDPQTSRSTAPVDIPAITNASPPPTVALPSDRRFFGIYDAGSGASVAGSFDVDHDFISWDKPDRIGQFVVAAQTRQRIPLITIDPWTTASADSANVLTDTARGANDAVIRADAQAIRAQAPQVVLLRFAHEMELTGNYPWAIADADLYIRAYRHYVDIFRSEGVTNVRWIWSPAGNADAPRFYPGNDYVDFVGLTVLSNEAWDLSAGAANALSFDALLGPKYATVSPFGKPIIIAEFGAADDTPRLQAAWLRDAYASFGNYPLLRGVIYFDSMNAPNTWTGTTPDFRIPPSLLWPESVSLPDDPVPGMPR
jgi:cellulose synthase (UDP-forming)